MRNPHFLQLFIPTSLNLYQRESICGMLSPLASHRPKARRSRSPARPSGTSNDLCVRRTAQYFQPFSGEHPDLSISVEGYLAGIL
jgi:hypothetical protein